MEKTGEYHDLGEIVEEDCAFVLSGLFYFPLYKTEKVHLSLLS